MHAAPGPASATPTAVRNDRADDSQSALEAITALNHSVPLRWLTPLPPSDRRPRYLFLGFCFELYCHRWSISDYRCRRQGKPDDPRHVPDPLVLIRSARLSRYAITRTLHQRRLLMITAVLCCRVPHPRFTKFNAAHHFEYSKMT